ncbi:MAG: Uncharacterised protein [Chloroflexota bacterium]|nr:MAG: Uncharacterised protein [Chloroflexota bacterium]
MLTIVVPDWAKLTLTPDKALLLDLIKVLPLMDPPDNTVFITNGLIFNVALEPESELSVESESLDESPELELLNESSFFAQEMMVRLKRDIRMMYKTLFIYFPISSIARNCNSAVFVSPASQGIEGYSIISCDRHICP